MDNAPTGVKSETSAGKPGQSAAGIGSKVDEGELVTLLAALRVEAAPEADFEDRFLYDLRERIAREVVCCPARTLLWEHIMQFLTNIGRRRRLAFGATACGAFALCSAYFAWSSSGGTDTHAEATLTNRFESTLSALKPGAAKDVTRISVGNPSSSRTVGSSPAGLRTSALFAEADETYEPSPYTRSHRQENISVPHSDATHGLPAIGF